MLKDIDLQFYSLFTVPEPPLQLVVLLELSVLVCSPWQVQTSVPLGSIIFHLSNLCLNIY